MKSAAGVLIFNENDKVLVVSRKNDPSKFGIPGGKVDPGETNLNAAFRETFEETGLILNLQYMEPIFSDICHGKENDFWTTTYLYRKQIASDTKIMTERGIESLWVDWRLIQDPEFCPFYRYNMDLLCHFLDYIRESALLLPDRKV